MAQRAVPIELERSHLLRPRGKRPCRLPDSGRKASCSHVPMDFAAGPSLRTQHCRKPIDIPTRETVAFLASRLQFGAELVEVGCGEGHVASELSSRGYRVIGIDSDHDVIVRAQERGVSAVVASWPEFDSPPIDAIAFTRSLHHIGPLHQAVERACDLLLPTGSLFVEDFAFDQADEGTIQWFNEVLRSKQGAQLIYPVVGSFVTDLLCSRDPVALWQEHHNDDIHSMTAMSQAIAQYFVVRETLAIPYLYRYVVPVLPETPQAAAFVDEIFREEAHRGQKGQIVLIGRRIVASPSRRAAVHSLAADDAEVRGD